METRQIRSFWDETLNVWIQYFAIGIGSIWGTIAFAFVSSLIVHGPVAVITAIVIGLAAAWLAWKAFKERKFVRATIAPLEFLITIIIRICKRMMTTRSSTPPRSIQH